jgi:hypothetical protein
MTSKSAANPGRVFLKCAHETEAEVGCWACGG